MDLTRFLFGVVIIISVAVAGAESGNCGTELVSIGPNQTYHLEHDVTSATSCLWVIVAENGTRVQAIIRQLPRDCEVTFYDLYGHSTGNDIIRVVRGMRFQNTYSAHVASNTSIMWIHTQTYGYSGLLRIDLNQYTDVECEENQFACPSGLDCLDDVSQVCDGRRDCLADGDELGCGECEHNEFRCATSGVCVTRSSICNTLADCGSEFLCDECGYPVYISDDYYPDLSSPNYPENYPSRINCNWEVFSRSIQVSILDFVTERSKDKLLLTGDTLHGGKEMMFELHGTTKIRTIAFNSSVKIHFTTDSTVEYAGFHLRLFGNFTASNTTSCPDADLFDCGDGSCVSPDARCDGFKDCQTNGWDELDCVDLTCPEFYHCKDSVECIQLSLVCDGNPDCPNEDDETDLECGMNTVGQGKSSSYFLVAIMCVSSSYVSTL